MPSYARQLCSFLWHTAAIFQNVLKMLKKNFKEFRYEIMKLKNLKIINQEYYWLQNETRMTNFPLFGK